MTSALMLRSCVSGSNEVVTRGASDLKVEIDRIASKRQWVRRNREGHLVPDYAGLADAAGLSRNGLSGILRGVDPEARTLKLLARYAGETPVRLYRAAGWLTDDDLEQYVASTSRTHPSTDGDTASLVDEVLRLGEVTEEEVLTALQVSQRLYQQLAERAHGQVPEKPVPLSEQQSNEAQG